MPMSVEDFENLPKEKPARAKVPNEELLEFLKEQACSTKEVAAFLGVQRHKWAYLAGFIDADGSISLTCHKGRWFYPQIHISQKNRCMLELVKVAIGRGSITRRRHAGVYRFVTEGFTIKPILEALEPYMILKREQVRLCLRFIELRSRYTNDGKPHPYNAEELAIITSMLERNARAAQTGTAYSRLKRLKEADKIEVGYSGPTAYWKALESAEVEEE